jgi:hypothetical protein
LWNNLWDGWFGFFSNLVFFGLSVFGIQFFVNFYPSPVHGESDEGNPDSTADHTLVSCGFRGGRVFSWGHRTALDGFDIIRVDHYSGDKIS